VTPGSAAEAAAPSAARWRALVWLALTSLLGMSTWFSGTAVIGPLREAWALTPAQGSWLTIAVHCVWWRSARWPSILSTRSSKAFAWPAAR